MECALNSPMPRSGFVHDTWTALKTPPDQRLAEVAQYGAETTKQARHNLKRQWLSICVIFALGLTSV